MENIKPCLVIYNTSENSTINNVDQDTFQSYVFAHTEFNRDLFADIEKTVETDSALVIIDAQANFPKYWYERLAQVFVENKQVKLCSALTCHIQALSPLDEKDVFSGSVAELDHLIYLLQVAGTFYCDEINPQCLLIRDKSVLNNLAQTPFVACNNLLVQSQQQYSIQQTNHIEIGNQSPLPAHPLAKLQWRLKPYLNGEGSTTDSYPLLDGKPLMLHITMGWGGGVHQWIDDYCQHEQAFEHLILSSNGELYRHCHGEVLSLHYGQTTGVEMQRFELQAPIKSTSINHPEYKNIVDGIVKHYQIQHIVVSSLIGHSMQCLQTGVATTRVLHDYFPSWPSLIALLDKKKLSEDDLDEALLQSKHEPFGQINKQTFLRWQKNLHRLYQSEQVNLVAPSQSVINNLLKIDKNTFQKTTLIPHAIADFEHIDYQSNGEFNILVLGRINPPKGQELLEEIMAELGDGYQFVLLGAGNEGKKYLNTDNIKVIMEYDNAKLHELLVQNHIAVALITSQTSETFNYTLSELQQAGICTISTKFGALAERIIDGETGFLSANNASAFAHIIRELKNKPERIKAINRNLKDIKLSSFDEEIKAYQKLMTQASTSHYRLIETTNNTEFAQKLLLTDKEKRRITALLQQAELTLDERTLWGQTLTKQLKKAEKNIALERKEAKYLTQLLEKETTRMTDEIGKLNQAFNQAQGHYEDALAELQQTQVTLFDTQFSKEKVEQELSAVYQSRSWRVTKPMRQFTTWARHKRNAIKFRMAQLKTIPSRAIRSIKTRGLGGTASVLKNKLNSNKATEKQPVVALTQDYTPIEIKPVNDPVVSIIIPVYNHFEHTYNCLKSIAALSDKSSYEVIVVDDCSSDETESLIKNISGILYQRQAQNGGFIESCNTGAKLAKGQYLMFLNNDTVVYDNWLDALIEVFENNEDAGLVGSKLVYPDNQLQEAGGIIFSDASGWNYGRFGQPEEPVYNHVREVDYCSGASILILRKLFQELGYFDERYKPAYYEDTDLAFTIRSIGKKVYYQPASKVTHFEGISSGTDLTTGMKKYQVVNQTKFKQKWLRQLAQQPKVGTDIELCRIHAQPKRILIFDACTPTPDQDSGSLRMINLIKILKQLGYHVIFMPENLSHMEGYTQALQQLGVECLYAPSISNPVDYLKDKGIYLDAVILSRYYVAEQLMPFIREYCPKARIIFDTVDLHYVRERRMAEINQDKKLAKMAEITRKKELAIAKACDVTLVVSPYEVEVLAAEIPATSVKVLTNIHEIYGCRKPFQQRKDIMFIGGYQHTPNVDAVEWFVAEILPLIIKQLPEIKFHIIGSKAPKHIQQMAGENIIFRGFVEDIEPIMDDIRIAVAPLRYGAGVKGKVNMSMSYGQPVVGTKVAVEGMFTVDEQDCLMAETAQQFANQVIRLYQDEQLWTTLSQGGLKNVEKYFSFAAAKQSIRSLLT